MRRRNIVPVILSAALVLSTAGCAGSNAGSSAATGEAFATVTAEAGTGAESGAETQNTTEEVPDETVVDELAQKLSEVKSWSTISLRDNSSTSSDNTVKIGDENKITIKEGGYYAVSGSLTNGTLSVKTEDENAEVVIKLCNVSISNDEKTALKIKSAGKVVIYLEDGSVNTITSGKETVIVEKTAFDGEGDDDSVSGGAINAVSDLTICGNGTLNVDGYLKMGIHSKKELSITSGNVNVKAVANAVKGNAKVNILGGDVTVLSGNDGLKASTSEQGVLGSVNIIGGNVKITAFGDGVQADGKIVTEGGKLDIIQSKEGMEAPSVSINGGDISIVSSDDGINASKANAAGEDVMVINGGKLFINSMDDGIDSNGDILVNGGEIIIDGPTNAKSGALDSGDENGGVLVITGGTVLAIGASGNDKVFNDSSSQCAFEAHLNYSAGETITVLSGNEELFSYKATKTGSSVVFSSPSLELNKTYTVTAGNNKVTIDQNSVVVNDMK